MRFFFKLFIKNADETDNPAVRNAYGNFSGVFGIITNVIMFLIKVTIGIVTSSISVTADAINNLCDAGSSVITIFGFKIAGKPADAKHPYGHARMEYVAGLIVSCLITAIGFDIAIDSFSKIITPTETAHTALTLFILGITVLGKLFQGFVYRSAGKKINSPALIATSTDSINDVISTIVVIIGGIISMNTGLNIDGWLGLAVAAFVIYSGVKLIIETTDPLLGAAPDEELVKVLTEKILSYDGVIGIHDLVVHNYGFGRCFASAHAEVPASTNVMISHDTIDNIEFDVLETMNIHLVIHLDPVETDNPKITDLKAAVRLILQKKDPRITMHDFRVVFGDTHTNIIFDVDLPFDYTENDDFFCAELTKDIRKIDPTYNTVITIDRNYLNSRKKN